VGEALEPLALGAFVAVLGTKAMDELVEIRAFQRFLFQSEVVICAQIVNPELFRPRLFTCGLAIEEQHIRFHTVGVKDAGRQTQQSMNVSLLQQLPADGLASASFEENIVWYDDGGPAMLLENGEDVLEEVELFVACRCPEIVTVNLPGRGIFLLSLDFAALVVSPG
jgi:hypothetical protein